MDNSPQKKKPRRYKDDATGDQQILKCDCCKNSLSDDHIRNNPCGHIVCFLCSVKSNMNRITNPACCQVMGCTQKYTISCQYFNRGNPGEIIENGTIVELGSDEVANILSFLPQHKIVYLRRVNMTWREAAKKTIVPTSSDNCYFRVNCVERFNAINVMTRTLPNLQQINLYNLGEGQKYYDGEDPDEEAAAETANLATHDIGIISHFSKLRIFDIDAPLNGRYPFLFNSFPLLQKLSIGNCQYLKWDLEMLGGFPILKELYCSSNRCLTGNINILRVLKDTLEKVNIDRCPRVEGNLMDLADFPHLKELDLYETAVTGDIRDIDDNDFSLLEQLILPKGVYGGHDCEFQRISDGPDLIRTLYHFQQQRPTLSTSLNGWYGELSEDSPDWYESADEDDNESPPFYICFVEAGSRLGYRWETDDDSNPCEVNWLDPEPDEESSDYEEYIVQSQRLNRRLGMYRGFYQPPTEEEYHRLVERIID